MKQYIILIAAFILAGFGAWAQTTEKVMDKKNLVVKEWNVNARGARVMDHMTVYSKDNIVFTLANGVEIKA